MNVPKLRFKEFDGEWENTSLGNLCKITKLAGFEFTKYVVYSDEGSVIALRALNVKKGIIDLTDVKYIDKSDFSKLDRSKLFKKDILFTYVGTIGEAAIVDANDKYYLAPNVCLIRPFQLESSFFILENISRENFKRKVIDPLVTTSSQPSLSMENIRKFNLNIPTLKEQKKISIFLELINKKIQLQQQKIDLLQEQKKGFLQKMFPKIGETQPEMRFEGFTGDWEERKLKEVGEINTGNTPSTTDKSNYAEQGTLWVTPTDIKYLITTETSKKLSVKGEKIARIVPGGTILVTCIASIGKNTMILNKSGFNQQINSLTPNHNNDSYFLLTQSEFWSRKMKNIAASGTMQIVNKNEFSNLLFAYPILEEQQRLGAFFKKLDDAINLQKQKLDLLQKQKQSFMQQMFI